MALKDTLATYARTPTGDAGIGIKNDFATVADAVDGKATSAQGTKADTAHGWGDHASAGYEPTFTKNTAFNKDFGSTAGTVCEGNDARLSDARTPVAHNHVKADITDFSDGDYATAAQGALADSALQNITGEELTDLSDIPSISGNAGKLLKVNPTENGYVWGDPSGATVSWGDISGTLSNQTDLQLELNGKATSAQGTKADTAHGWGDHASAGYLTSFTETNDLTVAVTWANIPDANVPESAVTQHEAALGITESQISDLGNYLESVVAGNVDSGAATDGHVLTADGIGGAAWEAVTGSASSLDDLTDVTVTTPSTNQVIQYNGSGWVNATISTGGLGSVIEDTTPQLGGTLDANGNDIDMGTNTITDTKVGQWSTAFGWGDHASAGYEPTFAKNTAFNKDFGSTAGTVCEGNDARLSDARTPTTHTHVKSDITDFSDGDYATAAQGALADSALQPDGVLKESLNTETTSGNTTLDLADGMTQRLTLGGNHQITVPADPGAFGQVFQLFIDCAGNTPTWASSPVIKWLTSDQAAPTLETTSGAVNVIVFTWDDGYNSGSGAWLGQYAEYAAAP